MTDVHHRFADIDGHRIFYRHCGHRTDPTVVLLHGAPSSSHMFRHLLPRLCDRYHVIAPDYLGFGLSDSPPPTDFDYTFDAIADIVDKLLHRLHVTDYAMYVHDHGAPVGWRLALRHPKRVKAVITQSGNAYSQGFSGPFWRALWLYADAPTAASETPLRHALTDEALRWQYTHGVADPSIISPDGWMHDAQALRRPGHLDVQLRLFRDYPANTELYPTVQEHLRRTQVPLLAVWGRHDEIFGPAGAKAFRHDLPDAEIHLIDGGHFLLESHLDVVADYMRGFLGRVLPRTASGHPTDRPGRAGTNGAASADVDGGR